MSWTTTDIATLERAIASGVLTVRYDGPPARSVTYQSTEQMLKVLALMKREVMGGGKTKVRYAATVKGY